MALTGTQAYVLSKKLVTAVVSGIKSMKFNDDGDLEIETMTGVILKRRFKDIKSVEFEEVVNDDGENEKHLIIVYSDKSREDIGIIDEFNINKLITIGTSEDEKDAVTPLFINTDDDNSDIDDGYLANEDDLNDLWKN